MLIKYITRSAKQTQEVGLALAKKIIKNGPQKMAAVLGLKGNLGGGKTTFLQGFSKGLGIKEKILSPTFVILKRFKLEDKNFGNFYHIDCYRLNDSKDILELDLEKIIADPKNIVAIEWPERIKNILPKNAVLINFEFIDKDKREIIIEI